MSESTKPTLSHRIEYAGLRAAQLGVRLLPERLALSFCGLLGVLAGRVFRIRRRLVEANLAIAFPDRSGAERERLAVDCYRHLGREAGALLRFVLAGSEGARRRVLERTDWASPEAERIFQWMLDRNASGRGVVLVTGHFGNWELAGSAAAARGLPLAGVAVRQRNPLVDRMLNEHRSALGIEIIDRSRARRQVLKALKGGRTVGLVADQHVRSGGVWIPFFGRQASTPRGPAVFCLRTGAPMVLGVALRAPGWPQRYVLHLERISFDATGDQQADVTELTRSVTLALERRIAQAPEQYLWQHRRWRTPPPEEPAP